MMYRVDLVQTVIEETTVYIEANDHREAGRLALREVMRDGSNVQWHFADNKDDPTILDIEVWRRIDLPVTTEPSGAC